MEKEILVSIVLPVQGSPAEMERAVRGVLDQTEPRWQLYLVESADTRGCADHWAGLDTRIQVLRHESRGRAACLRTGLLQCQGTYTVLLDVEHIWTPVFLALTTAFLQCNPLEDLVCMEVNAPSGRLATAYRQSIYREQGPLRLLLDPPTVQAIQAMTGAVGEAVWRQGELARHLRWGEYTRLAVTLLRTEYAELLVPAMYADTEALDYRLQARLAAKCAVNLLVLTGAVYQPIAVSPERLRQREIDALSVFDEIHGRQWETDPEVARLRRDRIARIEERVPLRALWTLCMDFLRRQYPRRPAHRGNAMDMDIGARAGL